MVELSRRTRGGRGGKLSEVLDHQLRIGDSEVSETIIAAYKERGLTPPENIEDPPKIDSRFFVYWEAYRDLQSERRTPRGTIPITAIVEYCRAYRLDPDVLKRIIWKVDRVLLAHWKGLDEVEKRKAELERANRRTIGTKS